MAAVLHLRDALAPGLESRRAVALAQGCLLSLGALALFLHSSRSHPLPVALAVGVLYSFHPLNLAIARVLSYYTLHIVLVTVATLALSSALQSGRRRLPWALAAGVLWGVATLVRPVSLLLPPFVLLLARWVGGKGSWRGAVRFTCLFTLGMALVIAPYSLRNYRLTQAPDLRSTRRTAMRSGAFPRRRTRAATSPAWGEVVEGGGRAHLQARLRFRVQHRSAVRA